MAETTKRPRTCTHGHSFYKSSDCPTCPICEVEKKPSHGFLSQLSAPARRALEGKGITTLTKLAQRTEKEILSLHGVGPSTIPILKEMLAAEELGFKTQ